MGKKAYISFASGPQYSLQIYDYATQIGQFNSTFNLLERQHEIYLLQQSGVKFNEDNLVFASKDSNGKVIWLEQGNSSAGLIHIINKHEKDFSSVYGIHKEDIPGFIKNMVISGKLLGEHKTIKNGKLGFERTYEYNNKYFTLSGIGTNGFIVSVYPFRKG